MATYNLNPFESVNESILCVKKEKMVVERNQLMMADRPLKFSTRNKNSRRGSKHVYFVDHDTDKKIETISNNISSLNIDRELIMNGNFQAVNIDCEPWDEKNEWCITTHFMPIDYIAINSFQRDYWLKTFSRFLNICKDYGYSYTSDGTFSIDHEDISIIKIDDKGAKYKQTDFYLKLARVNSAIEAYFKNYNALSALKMNVIALIKRTGGGRCIKCAVHNYSITRVSACYTAEGQAGVNCIECATLNALPFFSVLFLLCEIPLHWIAADAILDDSVGSTAEIFGLSMYEYQIGIESCSDYMILDSSAALLNFATYDGLMLRDDATKLARFNFKNATKIAITSLNQSLRTVGIDSHLRCVSYSDHGVQRKRSKLVIALSKSTVIDRSLVMKAAAMANVSFMGTFLRNGIYSFHVCEFVLDSVDTGIFTSNKCMQTKCEVNGKPIVRSDFFRSAKMYNDFLLGWSQKGTNVFTEPRDLNGEISYIDVNIDFLQGGFPCRFLDSIRQNIFHMFKCYMNTLCHKVRYYNRRDVESRLIFSVFEESKGFADSLRLMVSPSRRIGNDGFITKSISIAVEKHRMHLLTAKLPTKLIFNVTIVYSGEDNHQVAANGVDIILMPSEIVDFSSDLLSNVEETMDL